MWKTVILLLSLGVIGGEVFAQVDIQNPKTARNYYARGEQHQNAGHYEEAIADYEKAGELDPQFFDAHFSRSSVYAELKDYGGAISALTDSLKTRPGDYSALFNRGLYHEYLREYDNAIRDYTLALAKDADFSHNGSSSIECRAHAHHYRGRVYQWFKDDPAKAVADYTEALRFDPKIEMVHYRRGQAYHGLKEYAKAHEDFEEALKQDPDYPNLLNSWAWQLATCPEAKYRNGRLAVRLAKKTNHFETLAAAYAEVGEFEDAIATQKRVIQGLEKQKEPKDQKAAAERKKRIADMQARLAGYEKKQPYRDE